MRQAGLKCQIRSTRPALKIRTLSMVAGALSLAPEVLTRYLLTFKLDRQETLAHSAGTLAAFETAAAAQPTRRVAALYYGIGGYVQFCGTNYGEAMRLARQGIRQRADFAGAGRSFNDSQLKPRWCPEEDSNLHALQR